MSSNTVFEEYARQEAQRLVQESAETLEYSDVYEDEALEDLPEEDQLKIHGLIQSATVTLTWPEATA